MSPAIVGLEDLRKTYQTGQVIVEASCGGSLAACPKAMPSADHRAPAT
jgi:hypothetical protein